MNVEEQKKVLEGILGSPLPELDSIYHEASKPYLMYSPNYVMIPYVMNELFTDEEIKLVAVLPGTAKEIGDKVGISEEKAEAMLFEMEQLGKILATNVANPRIYGPHDNAMAFRDSIGIGRMHRHLPWNDDINAFRLMDAWVMWEYIPELVPHLTGVMRVIPKYASIKDLPGVMYCENMKEIFERNLTADTFLNSACVCRNYKSYMDIGEYKDDHCDNGLHENNNYDGHCFSFNRQANFYYKKYPDIPRLPREEALKRFEESEKSRAIFTTPNTRDTTYVCSCCTDCCAMRHYEKVGYTEVRIASRFRPTVNEKSCIGCGTCTKRCAFGAITIENGKAVVNEEKCKGCGNCVITCPTESLKMKIVHDTDWVPDVPYVDGWSIHDELEQNKD